jgi:hypothetical protein
LSAEYPPSGLPETREYDLTGLGQLELDVRPYFHPAILVGGLALAGWIGYLTYLAWLLGGVPRVVRPQALFVFGAAAVFFTILAMMFLVTGPSATRCSWDRGGFQYLAIHRLN